MNTPESEPKLPPAPARAEEPQYAPDLVALRDRMAEDGIHIRIPRIGAKWDLPEPIEVDGETASEILIRWRHAE